MILQIIHGLVRNTRFCYSTYSIFGQKFKIFQQIQHWPKNEDFAKIFKIWHKIQFNAYAISSHPISSHPILFNSSHLISSCVHFFPFIQSYPVLSNLYPISSHVIRSHLILYLFQRYKLATVWKSPLYLLGWLFSRTCLGCGRETHCRSKVINLVITVKQPQPGSPEEFQPIRNRSLNKEMNVRTPWEMVIFF